MQNAHDRSDRFSLLLHREVARAIESDAGVLARGRRNILRWQAVHGNSVRAWDEWLTLLNAGTDEVLKVILDEGEEATRLRQSSPFAGIIPNRRRWELLKESHDEAR
jgi:transposase-like protein